MNIDYSQFYRGTTNIPSYGNGIYKKDTLVKYEFNTTDEHGNKIMDKMSREETLQAMKDIGQKVRSMEMRLLLNFREMEWLHLWKTRKV